MDSIPHEMRDFIVPVVEGERWANLTYRAPESLRYLMNEYERSLPTSSNRSTDPERPRYQGDFAPSSSRSTYTLNIPSYSPAPRRISTMDAWRARHKKEMQQRKAELKKRDTARKHASVRSEQGYPSPDTPNVTSESSRPQTPTTPSPAARDSGGEIAPQHANQGLRTPVSAKTKPMTRRERRIEEASQDMMADLEWESE